MEYTINEVFDIKEEQIYQANEFLSKSGHELMHWRRALEESILMGKPRLICPYCHQMLKLCGRKCQRGVVSYFSHLYDSEDCPIKTTTQLTKEEIEIRKYGKVNESKRHQELKHLIADVLQDEMRITEAQNNYITAHYNYQVANLTLLKLTGQLDKLM